VISPKYASLHRAYETMISKKVLFIVFCVTIAILMMVLSVSIGSYKISFIDSFKVIIDHMLGNPVDRQDLHVIWNLRMPRAIMAVFAGAGLATGGAVMQSMMRNPLADPYIMGISSGASLGATISIILGISLIPGFTGDLSIILNAFLLSMIPVAVIVLFTKHRSLSPIMMILIGLSIMFIFGATTTLLKLLANPGQLAEAYMWGIGTLGRATWENIIPVAVLTSICMVLLFRFSNSLNILAMGDRNAVSSGVDPKRKRMYYLIIVSLMTATIVSFTGPIGFVGLVCPNIVRQFIGSDNRFLIPCSAAFGSLFLICADSVSKTVSVVNMPVGVVMALVGGPLFVSILLRMNKNSWA